MTESIEESNHGPSSEVEALRKRLAGAERKLAEAEEIIRAIQDTTDSGNDLAAKCLKNEVIDIVLKDHLARLPASVRCAPWEEALSSERDRALDALAESELRFRTLVEASPDAIFVNCNSKIVFANPATIKLLGAQTKEQVLDKDVWEIIHSNHLAKVKEQARIDLLGQEPSPPLQFVITRLNGSLVEVEGIGISVTWRGVPAIEVIIRDISERKLAEQVVLEWQKRMDLAQNAALPIGLWEWSLSDDRLIWSDVVYRQLGVTRENFRSTVGAFRSRVHPDDLPRIDKAMQDVIAGSSNYEVQFRVLRPDGSMCWLDSRGVMIHGEKPRMIGIAVDVTTLKTAEEAMRRSEARYRSIVKDVPCGIYLADLAKHFTMANPALINILGYESEDQVLSLDIGRDVYASPEERSRVLAQIQKSGSTSATEVKWKRKDGRLITVRTSVLPSLNHRGELEGFQGLVEDVTERKVLERQFWLAQKFEAIDRLAGGIAHDFNNVLMVVGSYAELIQEGESTDEQILSYANHIRGATDRAAAITRQLLAFSRKQILEFEVLDLNIVLGDLGKILPKLLGEDVAVTIKLDPELHLVKVDRGQMEQVIMNLAANARDAMPTGGRFLVNIRNMEVDAEYVAQYPPMLPGPYVVLSITDTGTGMDAKTKARIFEPFFTTKERGIGTGLGLASVYGIVKQSGGFIWVDSETGRGTTFDIYLPPVEEAPTKDLNPDRAGTCSKGMETVLLVEDEAELRAVAGGFLESKGYTVLVAGDGPEALRISKQHKGKLDVLLTDLVLPGMDGIEVAASVALLHPDARVLFMSGYSDRITEKLGTGNALLQKPFKLSALGTKLREVLAK